MHKIGTREEWLAARLKLLAYRRRMEAELDLCGHAVYVSN